MDEGCVLGVAVHELVSTEEPSRGREMVGYIPLGRAVTNLNKRNRVLEAGF